jgi:nicotinate dehydrogenase FAD-subunit
MRWLPRPIAAVENRRSPEDMRHGCRYLRPTSLKEALQFLGEEGSHTVVLAGGTDLMIAVRRGDVTAETILDVSRLEELRSIVNDNGRLSVGAAVTFTEIAGHPLVQEHAPVLAAAARCVGSEQIRNVGTLGGNLANASPAADSIPALIVHETLVSIENTSSSRTPLVEEVITAPYRTNLIGNELITRFLLKPLDKSSRHAFQRIARRRALAIARINAAALARTDSLGMVADLKLCVGSILPQPRRMIEAEECLIGRFPDPDLVREAAEKVSQEMVRVSGIRASTEYKRRAVEGLVTKVLGQVLGGGAPHA